jgi:uncharacterized MAPEG superfamily protein
MSNPFPTSPELNSVVMSAMLTGVLWVPIIVNRLLEMGPWKALKNPEPDVRPHAAWAYRLASAHRNAIENLVVFAPLAIIVHLMGASSTLTAAAAFAFFMSRVAHALIYTFGIPLLRTIAFVVGFWAQAVMALRIFGLT